MTDDFTIEFIGGATSESVVFGAGDIQKTVKFDKTAAADVSELAIRTFSKTNGTITRALSSFSLDLNYTSFFVYEHYTIGLDSSKFAFGTLGFDTAASDMPTTGSATYSGKTFGIVANVAPAVDKDARLEGDLSLTANFGTSSVTGTMTNMMVTSGTESGPHDFAATLSGTAWNNLSFTATFNNDNRFGGTIKTTNAVAGDFGLAINTSGSLSGQFFGKAAAEVGGSWLIQSGNILSGGAFGGKK